MAKLCVIQRVVLPLEPPEIATHVPQSHEVRILRQLEFLLQVYDLFSCFNLKELRLWHLDHYFIAIGACHREILLEDLDKIFDLPRQGCVHMLIYSAAILFGLYKRLLRTFLFRSAYITVHKKLTRLGLLA